MLLILNKKEFWGSVIFVILTFLLIGQITPWQNFFPFVHFFNAVTILAWTAVLYITWTKGWSESKLKRFAGLLILVALPHTIGSLLSYGSMICLGISVVLAVVLCFVGRKKQNGDYRHNA